MAPVPERGDSRRGCAAGDFDNDGALDFVVVNLNEPPSLPRKDVKGDSNWSKVKLNGVNRLHFRLGRENREH